MPQEKEEKITGKVLASYTVVADNVPAKIEIISIPTESVPIYKIEMQDPGSGTEALLNSIAEELSQKMTLEVEDLTDPHKVED